MPFRHRLRPEQLASVVMCPNCRVGMRVKRVTPVMFTVDFLEILYECPKCHTETKRQVKEPGK